VWGFGHVQESWEDTLAAKVKYGPGKVCIYSVSENILHHVFNRYPGLLSQRKGENSRAPQKGVKENTEVVGKTGEVMADDEDVRIKGEHTGIEGQPVEEEVVKLRVSKRSLER